MKNILIAISFLIIVITGTAQDGTVTDIDGNIYHTVKTYLQTWLIENLKTTKYNDGTKILNITDNNEWYNLTVGAYCNYDNDSNNVKDYGRLYNWFTVNTCKLCPKGWHVPSDSEWNILFTHYGTYELVEAGKKHWEYSNSKEIYNASGFTALPGGYYYTNFVQIGKEGFWWSSTDYPEIYSAWSRLITFNSSFNGFQSRRNHTRWMAGYSVRCLCDEQTQNNIINNIEKIKIYPNYTSDKIFINCANRHDFKMKVYNIVGKCLYQCDLTSGINEIDINSLTKGIYFVRLIGIDNTIHQKIVKE
jgi:uncharacterized protein (TIGR02145 family)